MTICVIHKGYLDDINVDKIQRSTTNVCGLGSAHNKTTYLISKVRHDDLDETWKVAVSLRANPHGVPSPKLHEVNPCNLDHWKLGLITSHMVPSPKHGEVTPLSS